ncbi:GNAT family N-acetyltransferase [Sphingomonas ginkgonis]|uniref:GNAT family N-acetyltransferase n=1 Tax=Sphingomonas ginkgonis TaxID=2315330 RepID=A0A3R9Y5D1_9SPHN|nr:GNAT family N-acetyltransferase [Sphingomonas ginkgonis]RST30484.1 GNAT family N-acetyltransferase [Sphingomonas ginkgonis]
MSLEPLADQQLAAVVTYLEMRARPVLAVPSSPLRLERWVRPTSDEYRRLFRRVGAPWLWFSRLVMDEGELGAILGSDAVELFRVVAEDEGEAGLLELDFREPESCELAFVGLVPELAGRGHGRWLLAEAVEHAWRPGVARVHVHTCSLDHPAALAAYRRAGFMPVRRAVETFADPRLAGVLPSDCAPQVPLLGTPTSGAASCA